MPKTASDTQRVSAQACAVEDCASPAMARGYCSKHYQRWRIVEADPCAIGGCGSPAVARGFCHKHYQRRRTHGDPLKVAPQGRAPSPPCVVEGCEGEHEAYGYCSVHYKRWKRHGDPHKVAQPQTADGPLCVVEGCDGRHEARGYCHKHYQRWRAHGDPHIKTKPGSPAPLCGEDYGRQIRAARLAAGLTQWTVAGRAGLSVLTVSQVERGTRTHPRLSTLKGFAGALGIPLSELLARPNSSALEND